uniref:Chromate transporter n=1 Tax=mine drainage metagenome TaxID=410659 RepID=E6QT12_9ZZZZ
MNKHTQSTHWLSLFLIFLRLGLTAFGGPIAHLAYFRQEFVARRQWLSEHAYAELVAFCQFTPGPASSKVGMLLGLSRGGFAGALAAWMGFTLPSAVALVWFGLEVPAAKLGGNNWHGLQIVVVAVVAQALWNMGKTLTPDKSRASIAVWPVQGSLPCPPRQGKSARLPWVAWQAPSDCVLMAPCRPAKISLFIIENAGGYFY